MTEAILAASAVERVGACLWPHAGRKRPATARDPSMWAGRPLSGDHALRLRSGRERLKKCRQVTTCTPLSQRVIREAQLGLSIRAGGQVLAAHHQAALRARAGGQMSRQSLQKMLTQHLQRAVYQQRQETTGMDAVQESLGWHPV